MGKCPPPQWSSSKTNRLTPSQWRESHNATKWDDPPLEIGQPVEIVGGSHDGSRGVVAAKTGSVPTIALDCGTTLTGGKDCAWRRAA